MFCSIRNASFASAKEASRRPKIYGIRDQLPNLKAIVVYWPEEGMPEADANSKVKLYKWDEFLATGASIPDDEILAEAAKVEPGSCATLIYTSGTTVGVIVR